MIRALTPQWIAWTQRITNLVQANFKPESAPAALLRAAAQTRLPGQGEGQFTIAKGFWIKTLEKTIEIEGGDLYGEMRGVAVQSEARFQSKKVFIVHGHDHQSKNELELFLKEIGLEPVVLHRQPDEGKTIIEKFEKHNDVGFAIILATPDDLIPSQGAGQPDEHRARQNVIFEWGYFIGLLGRDRVCCLYKERREC